MLPIGAFLCVCLCILILVQERSCSRCIIVEKLEFDACLDKIAADAVECFYFIRIYGKLHNYRIVDFDWINELVSESYAVSIQCDIL